MKILNIKHYNYYKIIKAKEVKLKQKNKYLYYKNSKITTK